MAHILILRNARSFVYHPEATVGVHEEIEQNIDKRKYPITKHRKGFHTPTGCEWKLLDYRIKKEVMPNFISDLKAKNLNPYPNNITLYQIFFKYGTNRSVGKLFNLIRWCFKWINRKKTTSSILFLMSVVFMSPFCLLLACIILANPVKPVPEAQGDCSKFTTYWGYNYVLGYVPDPSEKGMVEVQEDVL